MESPVAESDIEPQSDSMETTPVTAEFPASTELTEIEIFRRYLTTTKVSVFNQLELLPKIKHLLASDSVFQNEEDRLTAMRKWADDVQSAAYELSISACRLIDDIDGLSHKLMEQEDYGKESEMGQSNDQGSGTGKEDNCELERCTRAPEIEVEMTVDQ